VYYWDCDQVVYLCPFSLAWEFLFINVNYYNSNYPETVHVYRTLWAVACGIGLYVTGYRNWNLGPDPPEPKFQIFDLAATYTWSIHFFVHSDRVSMAHDM